MRVQILDNLHEDRKSRADSPQIFEFLLQEMQEIGARCGHGDLKKGNNDWSVQWSTWKLFQNMTVSGIIYIIKEQVMADEHPISVLKPKKKLKWKIEIREILKSWKIGETGNVWKIILNFLISSQFSEHFRFRAEFCIETTKRLQLRWFKGILSFKEITILWKWNFISKNMNLCATTLWTCYRIYFQFHLDRKVVSMRDW